MPTFEIFGTRGEEGTHYFRVDGYGNAYAQAFEILRKTPKGCWIKTGYQTEKFVLDGARRRWAYPTRALALDSYRIRKERQIRHCNDMITAANEGLVTMGFKAIDPKSRFHKTSYFDEDY
jgi:hypothetical protein